MSPRYRELAARAMLLTLITVVLFMTVEGASSVAFSLYILFVRNSTFMREEQIHAEYDADLGWVNRPNLDLPDLYGRGVGLRTNGQRFRADHDYASQPGAGISRVICSGDSFTMGHSVGNADNWCALLAAHVPSLETVNMGMAAYGVDQAYLWYRRDGVALQHQVHLLSFITSDFDRMAYDNFDGYPKPYLRVVDGRLRVDNVPVPRVFDVMPTRIRRRDALFNLSLVRHGRAVLERLGMRPPGPPGRVLDEDEVRAAARLIFEELQSINARKHSRLVLVYLPRTGDKNSGESDSWRAFARTEAERLGVTYVDLVEAFRELPLDAGERFFVMPYQPSHYSRQGNAWVARQLEARLFGAHPPR